jgi:ssDNA thymidine ADP-ribosyltransferase, DarT
MLATLFYVFMERSQVAEFHFIAPIVNVGSILQHGIVSHNRAKYLPHRDISMQNIQDLRAKKKVPGGLALHDYANLYFNGRNKMMAAKRPQHAEICVLRVSIDVLDLPGAVIADQNASSNYVMFLKSPVGLRKLIYDEVFTRSWICPEDQIRQWRLGSAVCAELLIPDRVEPSFIVGAYVKDRVSLSKFQGLCPSLPCAINSNIFL